jgi:hypothetical protein
LTDFALGSTVDKKFTTRRFTTGVPFTLAGSPVVVAYPDNSTTELTAGITLTVDFDSRTGLHNVRVVATSGNGYAAGVSYALVLTAGTVDGVSVVGEVVGEFTLERAALAAATLTLIADAILKRDWAAVSGEAARSVLNALRAIRNKVSRAGGTVTVTKEDDSTSAWTAAIVTDAAAQPITSVDPA